MGSNQPIANGTIFTIALGASTEGNYTCHLINANGVITQHVDIGKFGKNNNERDIQRVYKNWSSCF